MPFLWFVLQLEPGAFLQELKSVLKFLLNVNENVLRFDLHIVELLLMNIRRVEQLQELQSQENVCQLQKATLGT